MKRWIKLILLLAALALLFGCSRKEDASGTPSNHEASETQPAARSVYCITEAQYEYASGTYKFQVIYDEEGIHFLAEDKADSGDFHYDWNGREIRVDYYTESGELDYTIVNAYDEAGRKLSWTQTWPDGISTGEVYTYSEAGQLKKVENIDQNGERGNYTEYFYDEAGRLDTVLFYDYDGSFRATDYYSYNDAGQLVKRETVNEEGFGVSAGGYFTYSYDSQGRMTQKIWTDDSPSTTMGDHYYTYDAQGRLVNYQKWSFGSIREDVTYTYDGEGFLLGIKDSAYGITRTYIYGTRELSQDLADAAEIWVREYFPAEFVVGPRP